MQDTDKKSILPWIISIIFILVIVFLVIKYKNGNKSSEPTYEEKVQILNTLNSDTTTIPEEQKEAIIVEMQKDSKPLTDEERAVLLKGALNKN
ncbi:MAG: hypothetical protein KBC11_01930 [Candidatus Pacebacteria bacterium]|nr:hypothetical protein [Candidatus Paceibacterota bacterium]